MKRRPSTVGELRAAGYRSQSIRSELRQNIQSRLRAKQPLFPGVLGFDRTVIPSVVNAILAGHDFILLGLRGQAKTRLLRSLTQLLDDEVPILAGTELNEDPFAPISIPGRQIIEQDGDRAKIEWLPREQRYQEKLATPDVSIADLLGDIDPIKAATRRLTYADPEVIHFGIVPRTNRGIFAINELPDLAPRIQVGLLNILEERDLQIRGFPLRIPLDILLVFSANPEDYTNRGSIITPLKDRISSQILTHYPLTPEIGAEITDQEAWLDRSGQQTSPVVIPKHIRMIVEEIARECRRSELVDQSSGVSARLSIAALELLYSNLERRALATGDEPVFPRVCDLFQLFPAITGKIEMVYEGEQQGAEVVASNLVQAALGNLFTRHFPKPQKPALGEQKKDEADPYETCLAWFSEGNSVTLSDEQPFADYRSELARVPGLERIAAPVSDGSTEDLAFFSELVLEGLRQGLRLAREDLDRGVSYQEMVKLQLLRPVRNQRSDPDDDVN